VRFFSGEKHQEAKTSRGDYLLLAAQLVETGREKILKIATYDKLWARVEQGYRRLTEWLMSTAPQLNGNYGWRQAILNMQSHNNGLLLSTNCGI
jgi:hypothetical protein